MTLCMTYEYKWLLILHSCWTVKSMGSMSWVGVLFAMVTANPLLHKCFQATGESTINLQKSDPLFIVAGSLLVDVKANPFPGRWTLGVMLTNHTNTTQVNPRDFLITSRISHTFRVLPLMCRLSSPTTHLSKSRCTLLVIQVGKTLEKENLENCSPWRGGSKKTAQLRWVMHIQRIDVRPTLKKNRPA